MRDQVLTRVLDRFGPFDPGATNLLHAACELADQQLLSGAYIVLAFLRMEYLRNAPPATQQQGRDLQQLTFQLQRSGLGVALKGWIDLPGDYADDEIVTYGLSLALRAGREAARRGPITVTQLLHVVITHDTDVRSAEASLSAMNPTYATWASVSSASSMPRLSFSGGSRPSHMPFSSPLVRFEATTSQRYALRHHVQIELTLRELAERKVGQVLLARGLYGSPLSRLGQVLADNLIAPQRNMVPGKLASYKYVLRLDVANLHAAGLVEPGGAAEMLQWALAVARTWHAIVTLTRGELLSAEEGTLAAINQHILSALLQTGGVPVILAFEEANETQLKEPRALPFINARVVEMGPYNAPNVLAAIPEYYEASWRNANVQVNARQVLADMLQLEPAIYASSGGIIKRKALPYSAAELIQEAIEILHREITNGGSIRALALTAKQRLEAVCADRDEGRNLFSSVDLLDRVIELRGDQQGIVEAARKVKDLWQPRCELLLALPNRLQQLADNPVVEQTSQGTYVVSADIVIAQLLGDPSYHLHLMQAFKDDVCANEPRLLDEIQRAFDD